jgi:ribonuclease R
MLESYGIDGSAVKDRFGLQRVLKRLEQEPEAAQLVLNFMCLRSFKKAVYGIENIGHFALAFPSYAHFTSPIRRYPDLLVHRLVKRALALKDYDKVEIRRSYLDALAKQSSYLEQRAEAAERTLSARKSARYLSTRIGEIFPGMVTGATGGGLFVQLRETGMEGIVPVRELYDDFYEYDPDRMSLIGRSSGRVLGPGAEFDVQIAAVDIERSDVTLGVPRASRAAREDQPKRHEKRNDREVERAQRKKERRLRKEKERAEKKRGR